MSNPSETIEFHSPDQEEFTKRFLSIETASAKVVCIDVIEGKRYQFIKAYLNEMPLRHEEKMKEWADDAWKCYQAAKSRMLRRIREGVA